MVEQTVSNPPLPLNIFLSNNYKNRMLAKVFIPIKNTTKISVFKIFIAAIWTHQKTASLSLPVPAVFDV